jgi:hypothetical protein
LQHPSTLQLLLVLLSLHRHRLLRKPQWEPPNLSVLPFLRPLGSLMCAFLLLLLLLLAV